MIAGMSHYGDVYEVTAIVIDAGFSRKALYLKLHQYFARRSFATASSMDAVRIDIIGNRGGTYPDLQLEWCDEGDLLLCNLGPDSRGALKYLEEYLKKGGMGLILLKRQDADISGCFKPLGVLF